MAHTGDFKLDGKECGLLALSYHFYRQVDDKGRPTTQVRRGEITVTIASDDTLKGHILAWMAQPDQEKAGEIVLYTGGGNYKKPLKTVKFENAYVVDYCETYDHGNFLNIRETFTILAGKISVGDAKYGLALSRNY